MGEFLKNTIVLAICSVITAGCSQSKAPHAQETALGDFGAGTHGEAARSRLAPSENGLELRRWTILADNARLINVLSEYIQGSAVPEPELVRLKRNGFRFARIPIARLDQFINEFGGATLDANEWHGQVLEWRSLINRPIDSSGRAVVIDGKMQRFDRGEFQLMIRSWTVQMESGSFVQLEVLPQHRRAQMNDLRKLIGEPEALLGRGYAGASIDLLMEPEFAYVLIGESPQSNWGEKIDGEASTHSTTRERDGEFAVPSGSRRRVGPFDSGGPASESPMTLGEMLLRIDASSPARDMLVFVPKVSQKLLHRDPQALSATKNEP